MKKIINFFLFFLSVNVSVIGQNSSSLTTLWKQNPKQEIRATGVFNQIDLDTVAINNLFVNRDLKISIATIDANNNNIITDLELISAESINVKLNNSNYDSNIKTPIFYRGKVRGSKEKNDVLLTIAPNYISFKTVLPDASIIITKEENASTFLQYNSNNLRVKNDPFSCGLGVPDSATTKRLQGLMEDSYKKTFAPSDKTVYVFLDCTKLLFDHNSSSAQATINYVYSIWNDIRTAYANEQINIRISEINIWTNSNPFDTSTRELGLQTFAAYYQNNFWGNMAMLLDWNNGKSGVAGGFGQAKGFAPNVCGTYVANPPNAGFYGSYIYSDLNYSGNYQNFPVPANAEQAYLCTHELGHLLGSAHTHWCGWLLSSNPNVFGALDNCAAVEGTCTPGAAPINGGTFMSYCIGAGEFINFNNGFGAKPGAVIRGFVDGNSCILNNPACAFNNTIGALPNAGIYLYEASNQITANGIINGNNATYVKFDAGSRVILSPGFKATNGSKVKVIIDGCGGIR